MRQRKPQHILYGREYHNIFYAAANTTAFYTAAITTAFYVAARPQHYTIVELHYKGANTQYTFSFFFQFTDAL